MIRAKKVMISCKMNVLICMLKAGLHHLNGWGAKLGDSWWWGAIRLAGQEVSNLEWEEYNQNQEREKGCGTLSFGQSGKLNKANVTGIWSLGRRNDKMQVEDRNVTRNKSLKLLSQHLFCPHPSLSALHSALLSFSLVVQVLLLCMCLTLEEWIWANYFSCRLKCWDLMCG